MQTVWSRFAQARCICNCPSCLLTTNAIARRATTATARRTVRVGDVFTISLSSLAAGLAFADSRKKDDRRKQWDRAIAEAKASVEATEIQQQNRLAALSDARVEALKNPGAATNPVAAERAVKDTGAWELQGREEQDHRVPIPSDTTDTWLDVFEWAREQQKLREASGFQDWKGPPLSLLQSLSWAELDKLLSNSQLLRRFYGGPDCDSLVDEQSQYPLSTKKIRTLEWSVAKMVLKLLMYCFKSSLRVWEDLDYPATSLLGRLLEEDLLQSKLGHIRERLRTLHTDCRSRSDYKAFERPPVPNYDDMTVTEYEQATELNKSLQGLLGRMEKNTDLGDLMSKICYNLLTARTPPNTHTYNILLVRFGLLGMDDPVKAVLTSMRESHVRPNETTHANILRHFTVTGDRDWFVGHLKRMEGRARGLALAKPGQHVHPIVRERYWIRGRNHQKAFEMGRMNAQVYESLIVGAIKFLSGQIAMRYYRNMISEGWSPRLGISLAILQDCCRRLDWTVGRAVLEQLESTAERMNTLAYEWMLRLCQCCGQREFFDHILANGVYCGALPASILDLPDHAKDEDIGFLIERAKDLQPRKAVGALGKTAASISHSLGDKSPFLMENLLHDCEDEDTLHHTITRTKRRWRARVALEKRLDVISTDIQYTVLQANHALYASKTMSSIKFWLSRRIGHLKQELMHKADKVAYASYSDGDKHQKVHRAQATSAKDGNVEIGNSVDSSAIAHVGGSEAEYMSHLQPEGDCQHQMIQRNPPNLLPMTHPPDDSFWRGAEQQIAATA